MVVNNLIEVLNILLCVVCNELQFKNENNKAFILFKTGFTNNTLCYLNNLDNIINSYFN